MSLYSKDQFNVWFPALFCGLVIGLLAAAGWDILRLRFWCCVSRFWPGVLVEVGLDNLSRVEVEERMRLMSDMLSAVHTAVTTPRVTPSLSMANAIDPNAAESSNSSNSSMSSSNDYDLEGQEPVIHPLPASTGRPITFTATAYFADGTPTFVIRPVKRFFKRHGNGTVKRWKSSIVLQASLPIEACVVAEYEELARISILEENQCTFQLGNWAILYYKAGKVCLHELKEGDVPVNVEARWQDEKTGIEMRGLYLNGAQVKVATEHTSTILRSVGPATKGHGDFDELTFNIEDLDVPREDAIIFAAKLIDGDGISLIVRSEATFIRPERAKSTVTEAFWSRLQWIFQSAKMMTKSFFKTEDRQPEIAVPDFFLDQEQCEIIIEHWKGVLEIEILEKRKEVLHYLQELRESGESNARFSYLYFIRDRHSEGYWQRVFQELNELILQHVGCSQCGTHIRLRGGIRFLLGNYEDALHDLDCAHAVMHDDHWTTLYERALVKCMLARYSEALEDVCSVISINPNFSDIQELKTCIQLILDQRTPFRLVQDGVSSLQSQPLHIEEIPDLLTGDERHSSDADCSRTVPNWWSSKGLATPANSTDLAQPKDVAVAVGADPWPLNPSEPDGDLPQGGGGGLASQLQLPPGFRFYPTDEELVLHYLCRKAESQVSAIPVIAEIDLSKFDPWDLPVKANFGEREWYFFSPRDRKDPNGARPNRAAASGFWKATGTDKPIHTTVGGVGKIGVKKALVFYKGRARKGVKTNWIMHEYRLADGVCAAVHAHRKGSLRLDDWVLGRIYKKSTNAQRTGKERDTSSCVEEVLASLPEIDDPKLVLPRLGSMSGLPEPEQQFLESLLTGEKNSEKGSRSVEVESSPDFRRGILKFAKITELGLTGSSSHNLGPFSKLPAGWKFGHGQHHVFDGQQFDKFNRHALAAGSGSVPGRTESLSCCASSRDEAQLWQEVVNDVGRQTTSSDYIELTDGRTPKFIIGNRSFKSCADFMQGLLQSEIQENLDQGSQAPTPNSAALDCMVQLVIGMSWLHDRQIAHRDLKARNVLISLHDSESAGSESADSSFVSGSHFRNDPEQAAEVDVSKLITDLYSRKTEVHRDAAYQIRCLTKTNSENRLTIAEQGGIPFFINLLWSPDKMTQEHAVTALLNLSLLESNRALIMRAGAIDGIVHVVKWGQSMEARENAAATIQCLSYDNENKISIGNTGAIPALVELLQNGTLQGKKDAASALCNLTSYLEGNKRRAIRTGIITVLMDILLDHSTHDLDDMSLAILANLSVLVDGLVEIGNTEPVTVLINFISCGSSKGQELATALLCRLCLDDPCFIEAAYQCGASDPLEAVLRSETATLRCKRKAQRLFDRLSDGAQLRQEVVNDRRGVLEFVNDRRDVLNPISQVRTSMTKMGLVGSPRASGSNSTLQLSAQQYSKPQAQPRFDRESQEKALRG